MRRSAPLAAALLAAAVLMGTSCGPAPADPSAAYFPSSRLTAASPPPVDSTANLPDTQPVTALGPVSRPDPKLTPGVVAVRDATAVCQQPKRVSAPIPYSQQQAVFSEYRIPAQETGKYGLDHLVPLQLGGGTGLANLWPASTRGVGFHEKQQLNARLRILVCRGEVPLADAQQQIVSDWYSLWIKYGAA